MMRSFLVTLMVGMSLVSGTGRAAEALIVHVNDVDKSGSLVFQGLIIDSSALDSSSRVSVFFAQIT
jgi:hypothetical protein